MEWRCWIIRNIAVNSYPMQLLYMFLGCLILALGIWIQYKGGVAMMPGEALNRAVSQVTGKRFEDVKIVMDVLYILVAAVICLVFAGRLEGVREGSIVAALLIGNMIRLYIRIFDRAVQARAEKREA